MADDSKIIWRVNRSPRFPVLSLGEYLVADDGPRETIRRNMKYEKMAPTLIYRVLQDAVVKYLTSPARDKRILDQCHADLEAAKDRASSLTAKENCTYALRSLDVFEQSLNKLPIGGMLLKRAPVFKAYKIGGVNVSIQPTVLVEQKRPRGKPLVGALIVDTAKGTLPKTPEAKRKLTDGMTHAAYLLNELVSNVVSNDDEKPSTEHCMVFHTHRGELVAAPSSYRKMLHNTEAACRGIASDWDNISPPPSFDPKYAKFRK